MKILEMVGKKLEAELELFILDCHALSKDGIISKSEEIVMKRKIYRSLRNLLKGARAVSSFAIYRTHFGKCIPLCGGSKRRGGFSGIDFEKMDVCD